MCCVFLSFGCHLFCIATISIVLLVIRSSISLQNVSLSSLFSYLLDRVFTSINVMCFFFSMFVYVYAQILFMCLFVWHSFKDSSIRRKEITTNNHSRVCFHKTNVCVIIPLFWLGGLLNSMNILFIFTIEYIIFFLNRFQLANNLLTMFNGNC